MTKSTIVSVDEIRKYPKIYELYLSSPEKMLKTIEASIAGLWSGNKEEALKAVERYLETFG